MIDNSKWRFEIYLQSTDTPEEAHKNLAIMRAAIAARNRNEPMPEGVEIEESDALGGFSTIKIKGVTIHTNPFPPWFVSLTERTSWTRWLPTWFLRVFRMPPVPPAELEFEPINWSYEAMCESKREAEAFHQWILDLVKWGHRDPEKRGVLMRLRTQIWEGYKHELLADDIF
jgi:hypothetical protein